MRDILMANAAGLNFSSCKDILPSGQGRKDPVAGAPDTGIPNRPVSVPAMIFGLIFAGFAPFRMILVSAAGAPPDQAAALRKFRTGL